VADGRWAWTEIDTGAIGRNVGRLRALLPVGCRFMAVVKADAYGHGAELAARAALSAGADALGVATVEEAAVLHDAGVSAPIHLLAENPPSTAVDVVRMGLVPSVAGREAAIALSRASESFGRQVPFHLAVDTGMNRMGVPAEDVADLLTSFIGLPGLSLAGVSTHFATAEISGDWDFEQQMERFTVALSGVREAGFDPGVVHAANSAATILHPESHFSMVRCGIAIYGLHPGEDTRDRIGLEPAMSVRARVAAVRRIGMGDGVSYGFTWRAAGPATIATIPLGYADGLHRTLSDSMQVLVGGRSCRQVGRICMDQTMVEIPRGLDVDPGDAVVVVGEQGGEAIPLDELAETAGTINYEMACAFGMRLERIEGGPEPRI
jgi:alanine racemase